MDAYNRFLNQLVNLNARDYKDLNIKWITYSESMQMESRRSALLDSLAPHLQWSFKGTKPWMNSLSKGCQLCGEGAWSCLFITGKCNASCFYCPTSQIADQIPATQQFEFPDPKGYADYLNRFGFKAVSFSGGEPLLFPERLGNYLQEVRESCDPEMYIWMYTNGILGTPELFQKLADWGLNEVRFDIGATQYKLDAVHKAKGKIAVCTVEIPAIPDEEKRLLQLLPELVQAGVNHLNLHQLRLTPHNAAKLLKRNYSFLHGEQPVVMESELLVLKVMEEVERLQLPLGVNYCSFQYKRRFQRPGIRNRFASILAAQEYISEAGYLIRLLNESEELLNIDDFIREEIQRPEIEVQVFRPALEKTNSFVPSREVIQIGADPHLFKLQPVINPLIFKGRQIDGFKQLLQEENPTIPEDPELFEIWKYLKIEPGLRSYF